MTALGCSPLALAYGEVFLDPALAITVVFVPFVVGCVQETRTLLLVRQRGPRTVLSLPPFCTVLNHGEVLQALLNISTPVIIHVVLEHVDCLASVMLDTVKSEFSELVLSWHGVVRNALQVVVLKDPLVEIVFYLHLINYQKSQKQDQPPSKLSSMELI